METGHLRAPDSQQAGVDLEEKMREAFEWRAPAEIDDVFRIDRRFLGESQLNANPNCGCS